MEGEASVPKPVLFACDQAVAGLEVGFVAAEPDWTVEMLMGARRPWLARSQCRCLLRLHLRHVAVAQALSAAGGHQRRMLRDAGAMERSIAGETGRHVRVTALESQAIPGLDLSPGARIRGAAARRTASVVRSALITGVPLVLVSLMPCWSRACSCVASASRPASKDACLAPSDIGHSVRRRLPGAARRPGHARRDCAAQGRAACTGARRGPAARRRPAADRRGAGACARHPCRCCAPAPGSTAVACGAGARARSFFLAFNGLLPARWPRRSLTAHLLKFLRTLLRTTTCHAHMHCLHPAARMQRRPPLVTRACTCSGRRDGRGAGGCRGAAGAVRAAVLGRGRRHGLPAWRVWPGAAAPDTAARLPSQDDGLGMCRPATLAMFLSTYNEFAE